MPKVEKWGVVIAALVTASGAIYAAYVGLGKNATSGDKFKSTDNSGMTFQAAGNAKNVVANQTATWNSGQIIQASGNSKVNVGLTQEAYDQIVEGLKAVQKNKEAFLDRLFPLGYFLFTATDRKQIIPLNIPMKNIKVDWSPAEIIEVTDSRILLRAPSISFDLYGKYSVLHDAHLGANTVSVPRIAGAFADILTLNDLRQTALVVELNKDSAVMAVGFRVIEH